VVAAVMMVEIVMGCGKMRERNREKVAQGGPEYKRVGHFSKHIF
jgi:hypothetical protein